MITLLLVQKVQKADKLIFHNIKRMVSFYNQHSYKVCIHCVRHLQNKPHNTYNLEIVKNIIETV